MFHVRDSSFGSSEVQEGKESMELGSSTTASLSHCICFVGNSVILTVWNQKEKKELLIQNTISKEDHGFCFDSIDMGRYVIGRFTTVEK